MQNPPPQIDGANVVCFAILKESQPMRETPPPDWFSASPEKRSGAGLTADTPMLIFHYVEGELMKPPAALAICQYGGAEDRETYLFYYDDVWDTMQDDVFDSVEEALQQACVQCAGLKRADWHWIKQT